jgi:hypothetical protein
VMSTDERDFADERSRLSHGEQFRRSGEWSPLCLTGK